ncbi:MAG: TlpA family protein disulfide reductase, partial [Clostridia bacterium]|nr:TlpA family protein disulfide reductase [Clostridia bacterium]
EDIHFVMINLTDGQRETVESGAAYVEAQGFTFPVYFDSDLDAANNYQVYSVPMTYFLDAEGYAIARASGAIDAATLERGISMIAE